MALAIVVAAPAASKREQASRYYRLATQLLDDLRRVPGPELGQEQYDLVISRFRAVANTDPSSGYCDDALMHAADLYAEAATRFSQEAYRRKAVETYRFTAREYPHSKHRDRAVAAAARLSSREEGGAPDPEAPSAPLNRIPRINLALSDEHPANTTVRPPGGTPAGGRATAVRALRHHSYEDGTRVVIEVDRKVALKYDRLGRPPRLYVDLFDSRLTSDLIRGVQHRLEDPLLSSIRLGQNRSSKTRLVLDLRETVSFEAFWLDGPQRLVMDIRRAGSPRLDRTLEALGGRVVPETKASAPEAPQKPQLPAPRAAPTTLAGRHSLTRALGLKLGRILLDAGHGGHDTGGVGPTGLREKDVVVDIAERLGQLLRSRLDAEVLQTRTNDEFVPLEERSRMANEGGADLMISIHCNSTRSRRVRGVETYYLSLTDNAWELDVASKENAASNLGVRQLRDLVSKIALRDNIEESREFARTVQSKLHAGLSTESSGVPNRGVRKAPFLVLVNAQMPAILVEIAFISNRTDESLLRKESYRQRVAEYLYSGIAEYAATLGMISNADPLSAKSGQSKQD